MSDDETVDPMRTLEHDSIPTPEEALDALERFIHSHFRGRQGDNREETARFSIPANHKRDDDLRLSAFIRWAGRQSREVERLQRLVDQHVAEAARARVPIAGAIASTMDAMEDLRAAIDVLNGELFFPTAEAQTESEEKP